MTASGGQFSLLKVRQLWNNISDGPVRPNTIITDYTTWAYFEQLLQPFQRNNYSTFKTMNAGSGYDSETWDGMEIFRDKKIQAGNFYMLNTDYLKFYGLNW